MKNYDFTSSHLISSSNTTVIQIKTKKAENLILLFYSWSILFPAVLNFYSPSWYADSHPFLSRGSAYVLGLYHETWAQGYIIMSSQKINTHAFKCAFIHQNSSEAWWGHCLGWVWQESKDGWPCCLMTVFVSFLLASGSLAGWQLLVSWGLDLRGPSSAVLS